MPQAYQNFDHWLLHDSAGHKVAEAEALFLKEKMSNFSGKNACLIGFPSQHNILNVLPAFRRHLLTPLIHFHPAPLEDSKLIGCHFSELPIASGSMDVVLLPHVLELSEHPRAIFNEACRIVKPEGHLFIFGFNSMSLFRLWMKLNKSEHAFEMKPIPVSHVRQWLKTAQFSIQYESGLLYRPPMNQLYRTLAILDYLKYMKSFSTSISGAYVVCAQAKLIPVTPIRVQWKQKLADFHFNKGYVCRS